MIRALNRMISPGTRLFWVIALLAAFMLGISIPDLAAEEPKTMDIIAVIILGVGFVLNLAYAMFGDIHWKRK